MYVLKKSGSGFQGSASRGSPVVSKLAIRIDDQGSQFCYVWSG